MAVPSSLAYNADSALANGRNAEWSLVAGMSGSSSSNESSDSSSEFRPRLDQERRHRGGNQERDRDAGKDQLVALRAVVDRAGDEGAEDRTPGVEEIHVAADRAEGFAAEKIAYRGPENRDRGVEHA